VRHGLGEEAEHARFIDGGHGRVHVGVTGQQDPDRRGGDWSRARPRNDVPSISPAWRRSEMITAGRFGAADLEGLRAAGRPLETRSAVPGFRRSPAGCGARHPRTAREGPVGRRHRPGGLPFQHPGDGGDQGGTGAAQLIAVLAGQSSGSGARRAGVRTTSTDRLSTARALADDPARRQTVHQLDHGVVPDGHPLGQAGDGGAKPSGRPLTASSSWCCCGSRPTERAASSLNARNFRIWMPPFGQGPEVIQLKLHGGRLWSFHACWNRHST
jgi:hypothetical protein